MKVIFLMFIVLASLSFNIQMKENHWKYLKIEQFRIERMGKARYYEKIFDNNNRILLYKEGFSNITDSTVYTYNNNIVKEQEFAPDTAFDLNLREESKYPESEMNNSDSINHLYVDTFGLYDDFTFKEIDHSYHDSLKISLIKTDTGITYKSHYTVKEAVPLLILPYASDNLHGEEEVLDSLNYYCHDKKICYEEYYFKDQKITKWYFYNKSRLIKTITKSNYPGTEDYIIVFQYTYVNKYN